MAHLKKPSPADRISNFLQAHRKILALSLGVIVAGLVATFVYLEIRNARHQESLLLIENVMEKHQEWLDTGRGEDPEQYDAVAAEMLEELTVIAESYRGLYAELRARFIRAEIIAELDRYIESAYEYRELVQRFPRSHLASTALLNAAVNLETAGEFEQAEQLYEEILSTYRDTAPEAARALFSLGRLAEWDDRFESAAVYYNELLDKFAGSSWTNLARSRIIWLQSRNLIQ